MEESLRDLLAAARPACLRSDCEQPWLRVEVFYELEGAAWVPHAFAICEYGHRTRIDAASELA